MNPAMDFLLKKKGPLGLIPFLRALKATAELAEEVAYRGARGDFIVQGGGLEKGDAITGTDLFTPEIRRYESSALSSGVGSYSVI